MDLITSRLILRPWRDADLSPFARLNDDPAVMEFLPRRLSRDESDAYAGRVRATLDGRGWGFWAVEVRGTFRTEGADTGFTGTAGADTLSSGAAIANTSRSAAAGADPALIGAATMDAPLAASMDLSLIEPVTADSAFIGFVGLSVPSFDAHFTPCVEIGWRLAKAHWGRGYASEAAAASLRFAFENLKLQQIVAFTVPLNMRSRRVMERIGMSRDAAGDFEHPKLPPSHPLRPHVLYRINRTQWLNRQA